MIEINKDQLERVLDFPNLIKKLELAFQSDITVPVRHHHDFPNPKEQTDSTLLLMPAWEAGKFVGVKLVTVSPNNGQYQLPSIHGIYILFNAHTGQPLAQLDAQVLTKRRTAAASALASGLLSRENSSSLLMVGTGALAPNLISAHCTNRPIKQVYIWGRNYSKTQTLAAQFKDAPFKCTPLENLFPIVSQVDIISCATLSETPLIKGEWLKEGQHIDLVGSYKPNMREADNAVIEKASIFVDILETAPKECGDILIPIQEGILQLEDIKADLFSLCNQEKTGRRNDQEITLFKSVGHALEDLAAAKMAYQAICV